MLCPVARAAPRTRRASPAGSFTVKTSLRPGTSMAPSSRPLHVAARLAFGEAVTTGEVARRLDYAHPGGQQFRGCVDALGHLVGPGATTISHDTYILPFASLWVVDRRRGLLNSFSPRR